MKTKVLFRLRAGFSVDGLIVSDCVLTKDWLRDMIHQAHFFPPKKEDVSSPPKPPESILIHSFTLREGSEIIGFGDFIRIPWSKIESATITSPTTE
jgi:hypothetical protein